MCGRPNPVGFRKLRRLIAATCGSLNKAVDRLGPDEVRLITEGIRERIDQRREIGGSAPAKPAPAR